MESSKDTLFKKTIFVTYVLAFIGLTSFGIWDVTNIVMDYLDDNQFCLVKVRNNTIDNYRFVPALRACLQAPPSLQIFGSDSDFNRTVNSSWHQEDIVWPRNMSENETRLASDVIDLVKLSLITQMDNGGLDILDDNADILGVNSSVFKMMVSNYIENPQSIISTRRALETVKNIIIKSKLAGRDPTRVAFFGKDFNTLCVSMPLGEELTLTRNSAQYFSDFAYAETNSNVSLRPGLFQYKIAETDVNVKSGRSDKLTSLTTINIVSNGLFDSKLFPPCTLDFETESDCLQDIKRRTIAERCQCTQFSYAWRNDFFGNKTDGEPFCTTEIYEKCWDNASEEAELRYQVASDSGECKPCIFARNTYTVSTTVSQTLKLDSRFRPWYPASRITFQCTDATYLYFEQKQQFGPSQLISQVGGDLGLYIGFSMMSILQLIVYLYNMHRRRKESANVVAASSNERGKWLLEFFMQHMFQSVNDLNTNNKKSETDAACAYSKNLIDLKSESKREVDDIRRELNEMRNEIGRVEQRIYQKLDAMFEQKSMVSKPRDHWSTVYHNLPAANCLVKAEVDDNSW